MDYDLIKVNAARHAAGRPELTDQEAGTALMQVPKPAGVVRDNEAFLIALPHAVRP